MKLDTPFPTTGYNGPENFCDREQETAQITQLLEGGQSITLISVRRMGKTSLIRHLEQALGKRWLTVYLDIFKTENYNDLLDELGTAILRAVEESSPVGKKVWGFLKSIRPSIQFNELSGLPNVSFDVMPDIARQNIQAIFQMLEIQKLPVLIAIDEFQQITQYPEKNVDAWLRSIVQQLNNVVFIFSGSQHHVMTELFTHPKRPFFSSTSLVRLGKIDKDIYARFIIDKFEKAKRQISREVVDEILDWTSVHTYYVQLLCNRVYHGGYKKITSLVWKVEVLRIMEEYEHAFYNFRNLLTKSQWDVLRAIAKEETVYAPTAGDFIRDNDLGSSAAVLRALDALIQKDMVYYDFDKDGNKFYKLVDMLLIRWFQNIN